MMEFDYKPCGIAPSVVKRWPECDVDPLLKPVDISTNIYPLDEKTGTFRHEVAPSDHGTHWFIMGFRVFNGPREIVIDEVVVDCYSIYKRPFDAAAFNLEMPPPPLMNSDKPYAGEPMRFVKQEIGRIARYAPIRFTLRPWEDGLDVRFDALLIVREELSSYYPGNFGRMPPTCPPYSGGK